MNDDLKQTIVGVLLQIAPEADPSALSGSVPFRDQLDLEAIDQKLGIEVPEADYPKLMTLDGCVAYLARRRGGPQEVR